MKKKLSAVISIPRKELVELYMDSDTQEQVALLRLFGEDIFRETKDVEADYLIRFYTELVSKDTEESKVMAAMLRKVYGEFLGAIPKKNPEKQVTEKVKPKK